MNNHVSFNLSKAILATIFLLSLTTLIPVAQGFAAEQDSSTTSNLHAGEASVTTAADSTAKIPLEQCKVSLKSSLSYTATPLKPEPKVKYKGQLLTNGKDYKVTYKNNKAIGTADVTIKGKGRFTGKVTKNFKITYSNIAIAVAACRLSYSKSRVNGTSVSKGHGYRGTVLYQKYASKTRFSCSMIVRTTINKYLRLDKKFPGNAGRERKYMNKSKDWKAVFAYKPGMEYQKNTKLRPGDIYNASGHTCIYVGSEIAQIVYKDYLKADKATKAKLKKRCADLGKPSKSAVWVSSHATFMNGSAAHICSKGDALVNTHSNRLVYRYVGKGNNDPNGATR